MKEQWDSMGKTMRWVTILMPLILTVVGGGSYKLGTDQVVRNEENIKHLQQDVTEARADIKLLLMHSNIQPEVLTFEAVDTNEN